MNWINDMFSNKGMEKEASQTDRDQEFTRKVKSTDWLEGALKDADALDKEAAYVLGDDMAETIKKDYELAVQGMSDHNIAEMLAEHILMADGVATDPLKMSEEKEKQLKSVSGNRSAAESKLLKLIGEHTMIDWKEKFKAFRDAKPVEAKEADLYEPKFEPKKQNWEKKEDFEAPSDKEKTEQMAGTGKEEEKGAIAEEIKSKASKEEIVAIFKTAEVASPWVASKDEQGNDVIAKVEPETNTKESEKDKDDLVK